MRAPPVQFLLFPVALALFFATREYQKLAYASAERFFGRQRELWFPGKEYRVVIVGRQGAGKSSVCQKWTGVSDVSEPTHGFSVKSLSVGKRNTIHLFDLGGSAQIMPYWKEYFEGCSALVFVIDSKADESSFQDSIDALCQHVLSHDVVMHMPILALLNKCDSAGDVASAVRLSPRITDALQSSKFHGVSKIIFSSATTRHGDGKMGEALSWLISAVITSKS